MKIKIVKCDNEEFWYHDKIGNIYEVVKERGGVYILDSGTVDIKDTIELSCYNCKYLTEYPCLDCNEGSNWEDKMDNEMPELKPGMIVRINKDDLIYILIADHNTLTGYRKTGRREHITSDDIKEIYEPYGIPLNITNLLSVNCLNSVWKRKVEFAKPIWCDTKGQQYKHVNVEGYEFVNTWDEGSASYYCRKAGNMFDPDAVIPQEQIDKIVADMKGENTHA